MWRTTGTLLLLVTLAFGASVQNADELPFVAGVVITDHGPVQVRVDEQPESLVAEAPLNEESKKSNFLEGLRVMRSNVFPEVMNAVGLGQGNQLADGQKTYEVPLTADTVTFTYGDKAKTAITTQISLEVDGIFVYGKKCAAAGVCKKTAPKTIFNADNSPKTSPPSTFNLNFQGGFASGDNHNDKIALNKDLTLPMTFGVADAGSKNFDMTYADGLIGLGFDKSGGLASGNVKKLLSALAPSRALTIWKSADLTTGVIRLGDTTYEKCPSEKTDMIDAVKDKNKVQRWWFKADKIEFDGKKVDSPTVKLSMDFTNIHVPQTIYDQVMSKMDDKNKTVVSDASKLPVIQLTIGKKVVSIDGSMYTLKLGDSYVVMILPTVANSEYHVMLGDGLLSKACVVLQQKDDKGDAFQVGLLYNAQNFSPSTAASMLSLLVLPLVYLMGL